MTPERMICGRTYAVQQLPTRKAFRCLAQIRGMETALDVPDEVVNTFLEVTTVDGKPLLPVVDELLRGKMTEFQQVIAFALEVNFADFFVAVPSGAASPAGTKTPEPGATSPT